MSKRVAQQVLRAMNKLNKCEDSYLLFQVMRNSFLKWRDITNIKQGKKRVYTISPQLYTEIELLDSNHEMIAENLFYEADGNAVSGSGADEWIVADQKALDRLEKILESKKSGKKVVKKIVKSGKKGVEKSGKKSGKKVVKKSGKTCIKQHTKKYVTRSSPPYPANACPGLYMKGNDDKMYASLPDINGVYRWIRI